MTSYEILLYILHKFLNLYSKKFLFVKVLRLFTKKLTLIFLKFSLIIFNWQTYLSFIIAFIKIVYIYKI